MKRAVLACASVGLSSLAQLDDAAPGQAQGRGQDHARTAVAEAKSQEVDEGYCGRMDDNVDYWASNLYHVYNVSSAQACCSECQRDPDCRAWTWGKARHVYGLSNVCYLKGLAPGQVARRKTNENTTSGLPFRTDEPGKASLFCFTSILAEDVDPQLLALQHMYKAGIFSCEEYDVYTRRPVQLVPGVRCTTVERDADCSMGDHASSCASFGFVEVWQKVVSDGRFRYHNWTVKVDPDAVFFPGRLLKIVANIQEPSPGVYLSNCDAGLMEPLEVLSRKAVQAYALGYMRCVEGQEKLGTGDYPSASWNEGTFMDQCLLKVLKVERRSEMLLLSDPNCQSEDMSCKTKHAAFHPVDRVGAYHDCLSAAQWPGLARIDASAQNATPVASGSATAEATDSDGKASESFGTAVRVKSFAALPPAQEDQWT